MEHKDSKIEHDNFLSKSKGFFSYVFNFDEETKKQLYNITQYLILAFIFIGTLISLLKHYFPVFDESHSTIEITIKMILYVIILIYSVFYINRIICFIPTISGSQYSHCGNIAFIFPMLLSILISMISFNIQINEGINILIERTKSVWGSTQSGDTKKKKKKITNSNEQQNQQSTLETQQVAPTLYSGQTTPISQLPVIQMNSPQQQQQQQQQQQHNYSYDEQPMSNEPMAANAGGSAFGGAFGDAW